MITLGIDIGSSSIKSVLLKDQEIVSTDLTFAGGNNKKGIEIAYKNILEQAGITIDAIDRIATTGYGRNSMEDTDKSISEILCHAKGMHYMYPEVRTVLDIGGQDMKVISIDDDGSVQDFLMNDKCAAGCGKFLDIISKSLDVKLEDLGEISMQSTKEKKISSMCVVFAETEIISLVAEGTPIPDIIKGVHSSIADRAVSLLQSLGITSPIGMCGGVTKNIGIVTKLEEKLGEKLYIPEKAQFLGALGAALFAQEL